jgi:biopolymer transport protein ExbD
MRFSRKVRRPPIINIISLIDILVVLLIFYIATTVFKKSEPKINIVVPSSTHAGSTKETTPSIIYVTADNKMYLDDTLVQPEQLADLLKQRLKADPNYKVAMKADTKAPFGMITKVMDAANTAGIPNLPTFTSPAAGTGEGSGGGAGQ